MRTDAIESGTRWSRWETRVQPKERIPRARAIRWVIAGVTAAYFFYALFLGAERAVLCNALALVVFGLSWVCDERLNRDRLGAHLLLAGGYIELFGAALGDGALQSSGLWHVPLLSLGAGFLLGTRAAIGWALMAGLAIIAQAYIQEAFEIVRDYPFTRENVLAMRLFGIVVAALFGYQSSKTTRGRLSRLRRKVEEIQQATLRAEQASKLKSNFLAQVSHELRTPMNGILGMTQYLQRRPSLCEGAKEHVDTIHRCSTSLLSLFGEILDLSRVESTDWEIHERPVDLVVVVREVGDLFAAQANKQARRLRIITPESSCWVWGDSVRLSQVLSNLVGNAVKFCEQGMIEVELCVNEQPDAGDGLNRKVEIVVRDQGTGMTRSQSTRIFSAFAQVEAADPQAAAKGSGLGLLISREIVRKMGGCLDVDTTLGEGSEFTVSLGMRACTKGERPSARPCTDHPLTTSEVEDSVLPKMRVLVVDDLAINRKVACLALQRLGCEVEEAPDGQVAVDMADKTAYDCIFMDLRMPRMDGFEATRQILKGSTCNRDTPIVALSASAFDEDKKQCFEVGMVAHVAKPFRGSELHRILHTYVTPSAADRPKGQEYARAA